MRWLLAAALLLGALPARAERLPLIEAAHAVGCGGPEEARQALERLRAAPAPLGVPAERLTAEEPVRVEAAVLDIALAALDKGRRMRPELAPAIEALVRRWSFCNASDDGRAYDVELRGSDVVRRSPVPSALPLGGRGFRAWKVWTGPGEPEADPADGCGLADYLPAVPPGPLPAVEESAPPAACRPAPTAAKAPPATPAPRPKPRPRPPAPLVVPPRDVAPVPLALPPGPTPTTPPPSLVVEHEPLHLSGALSNTQTLAGPAILGSSLGWSPFDSTFLRTSVGYRTFDGRRIRQGTFTWSWGVGYDDWHPGTFSIQLNNWGPLPFSRAAKPLHGALVDVGYKVPAPALVADWLALSLRITQPLHGNAAAGATIVLIPTSNVSLWVSPRYAPWDPVHWTWTYGGGYSDWHPFTLGISYANYNPNRPPQMNFRAGAVIVSLSWAL